MTSSRPYDPNDLDIDGSRADIEWLRAFGITNIPERIESLLRYVSELEEKLAEAKPSRSTHAIDPDRLAAIRRRLPTIPRDDMSLTERDRADLMGEADRLNAAPDIDTLRAMLDRAGIPYRGVTSSGPDGGASSADTAADVSVLVPSKYDDYRDDDPLPPQTHPGGYNGFYTEHVFTADGSLYAVWAWE